MKNYNRIQYWSTARSFDTYFAHANYAITYYHKNYKFSGTPSFNGLVELYHSLNYHLTTYKDSFDKDSFETLENLCKNYNDYSNLIIAFYLIVNYDPEKRTNS